MLKTKYGFTMIELLVVVSLIAILIGAVIVSMNNARLKAQLASFKSETRGSLAGLAVKCVSAALVAPADTTYTNWGVLTVNNCASGNGRFSITAVPANAALSCTATVTESGVKYAGAGC